MSGLCQPDAEGRRSGTKGQPLRSGSTELAALAGLAMFGLGGLLYLVLLCSGPLKVAQVFTARQFVGAILAANPALRLGRSPGRAGLPIACMLGIAAARS